MREPLWELVDPVESSAVIVAFVACIAKNVVSFAEAYPKTSGPSPDSVSVAPSQRTRWTLENLYPAGTVNVTPGATTNVG